MSSHQGCERGPCLSAWWNVLPLFFANYALPRRDTARRVLGAAGSANERFHISVPGTYGFCTFIINRPRPASLGITTFREVRQPRKAFVTRCATAKALGLEIPLQLQQLTDEVIE